MSLPPYPNPDNDPVESECGRDWLTLLTNWTIAMGIAGVCSLILFVFGVAYSAGQLMRLFGG